MLWASQTSVLDADFYLRSDPRQAAWSLGRRGANDGQLLNQDTVLGSMAVFPVGQSRSSAP
jgi:hypothetical protein